MLKKKSPSETDGIKKVQVGCGPKNILDDWWNVDIRRFNGIDEVMDVTTSWPWENTLDYVYGEHFLEHLTIDQAILFLIECGKSLVIGGRVRLSTPSLEWVLKTHYTFEDDDENCLKQTWAINRAFKGWGHQFLYSKPLLHKILEMIGYESISFFDYGESDDNNLRKLERHGGWNMQHGYPSVWIVEGVKKERNIYFNQKLKNEIHENFMKYVTSGH